MIKYSVVIPAFNEEDRIAQTMVAVRTVLPQAELIVIDDGSTDETAAIATDVADLLLCHSRNRGKGAALQAGWRAASGQIIVCLDADLGESAKEVIKLLPPIEQETADVSISLMKAGDKAGNGLVKRRAQQLIRNLTGVSLQAPLSGQRVFHRKWLPILLKETYVGYAIESKMTIDLVRAGAVIVEIPTEMTHREMGKGWRGSFHRLKQWIQIERQCKEV